MTKIEWADKTWNPITGCTPVSSGCKNCYAKRMSKRLAGRFGYPEAPNSFDVTIHYDKIFLPLRWKKPSRIFVCSMSDLFHEDIQSSFRVKLLFTMRTASWHTFMILTKRPLNITHPFAKKWLSSLPNLWLGVTTETQKDFDERMHTLSMMPVATRFISAEPLLGPLSIKKYTDKIDWVICGGETGPGARVMQPVWALSLKNECAKYNIPFFFKKWGAHIPNLAYARSGVGDESTINGVRHQEYPDSWAVRNQ